MATIKSYTDTEQSRKLAEILPIESADMIYVHTIDLEGDEHYDIDFRINQPLFEDDVCAWSLAALLNVLPDDTDIVKDKADTENEKYMCTVGVKDDIISTFRNNPVDVCVAMIFELHELKML